MATIKVPKHRSRQMAKGAKKYERQRRRTDSNKLIACIKHVFRHPNDTFAASQLLKRRRGL